MSYTESHYLPTPPQQYYTSPQIHQGQPTHVSTPTMRQETTAQRKRPKYTRSKTGCLTCRVKKIKCDEQKPNCLRCTHGQRDCTWPEGVPARKKSTSRKDSLDGRPSTANSSVSDGSTPPTRDRTPPRALHQPLELGIPPLVSRRSHDSSYLQLAPLVASESRRQGGGRFAYSGPTGTNSLQHLLPEITSFSPGSQSPTRYETSYASEAARASNARPLDHHHSSVGHWSTQLPPPPTVLPSLSSVDHHSYYHNIPRTTLDSHDRYQ